MTKKATTETETIRIVDVRKDSIRKTGQRFLDVTFEVMLGKKVVDTIKEGFPIDTEAKAIEAAAKAKLKLRGREAGQAVAQKEQDDAEAQADKTIDKLVGVELK
ncbi:hypothetical protein KAU11_10275 [Candidatus Babeliales bacterium]|nr:hypothetical protein [Candidatus Babeliales bacterium]